MTDQRIVLTGAAGRVAGLLRPRLAGAGRTVRLLDLREPAAVGTGEEPVVASVDDLDAMTRACEGADAVVHLGGQSREAPAEEVLRHNALGTYCVLEAARRTGISRVVLASSNHVAGFYDRRDAPDGGFPADAPVRPDTLYGWSKAAMEAAGRLYVDRYGMDVVCLRIGMCAPEPPGPRGLSLWLSPDDCARLVEASLSAERPGFRVVWGISRNSRRWTSLAEGAAIGYHPEDDAEVYAERILAEHGAAALDDPAVTRVGGHWCEIPLGVHN